MSRTDGGPLGTIGPQREILLFEIVAAYLSTSHGKRQAIGVTAGGNRLQFLHPGFSGYHVEATEEDLRVLVSARLISRTITHQDGDGNLVPTEKAIRAYNESRS